MDLRAQPRYPVSWPVTVRLEGLTYVEAQVLDVGVGGIGLSFSDPTVLPSHVTLLLGTDFGPILGRAEIRWSETIHGMRAGALFSPHHGYSQLRFESLLRQLANGALDLSRPEN